MLLYKYVTTSLQSIRYEPTVFFYLLLSYLKTTPQQIITSYTEHELLDLFKDGKSLIRVGDGEAMLLMGRSIHYQKFTPELRSLLKKIITTYTDSNPYILAIPLFALTETEKVLQTRGRARIWRLFRVVFPLLFPCAKYADAVMFYRHGPFERLITPIINQRHVIVVTNKNNCTDSLLSTLSKSASLVNTVITPNHDAYEKIPDILSHINVLVAKHTNLTPIVLVAAGPAGKIITHDLAQTGVQCLDIGHGIEIIGKDKDYAERL